MQNLQELGLSLLTENVLKVLTQSRISSVLDFLNEDLEKLSNLTKLSPAEVTTVRKHICDKYSAPVISGIALQERHKSRNICLSTGLAGLDTILEGGLPVGYVTEICGLAGSGKTQLCYQLAINCVRNTQNAVLYIDTKGDFSAIRIQKVLDLCGISHKEMAEILFHIKVIHVWDMSELIEVLQMIKNQKLVLNNLSMIIIDSLPSLMFQHLGDNNKIGLTLLNNVVNYCRYLCNHLQLCVVCVNIQTRWVDQDVSEFEDDKDFSVKSSKETTNVEKQNRCLGKYWQQIPALVLTLERCHTNNNPNNHCNHQCKITVTATKSSCVSKKTCNLNLNAMGYTSL